MARQEDTCSSDVCVAIRAQAQAALMMMDSLLIVLASRGVVPANDLIDAIDLVVATQRGFLEADREDKATVMRALAMLSEMANNLRAADPERPQRNLRSSDGA
jgi:hypothetical protein